MIEVLSGQRSSSEVIPPQSGGRRIRRQVDGEAAVIDQRREDAGRNQIRLEVHVPHDEQSLHFEELPISPDDSRALVLSHVLPQHGQVSGRKFLPDQSPRDYLADTVQELPVSFAFWRLNVRSFHCH